MVDGISFQYSMHLVSPPHFYSNAEKLINSLTVDYSVDREQIYNDISIKNIRAFSALELQILARNLNVHSFNLIDGNVCIETMVQRLKYGNIVLPRLMRLAPYSSTTSLSSLACEAKAIGRKEDLLLSLQIDESLLNEHRPLSVLACRNALETIKHLLDEDNIKQIGINNAKKFCSGKLGNVLLATKNISAGLDAFIHHSKLVERNWTYEVLKQTSSGFLLFSEESSELLDNLTQKSITTDALNTWRWSFLEEVLRFQSGRDVSCIQQGLIGKYGKTLVEIVYS